MQNRTRTREALTGEARQALDAVDEVLAKGGDQAASLWAILSAVRGPDNRNMTAKTATTVPIRAAAFPKTARSNHHPADMRPVGDARFVVNLQGVTAQSGDHFKDHVKYAADALNLLVKE